MPKIIRVPIGYERAERDFFVYRSMILPDKAEEAFLRVIHCWLEMADSALEKRSLFIEVKPEREH